MERHYEPSIEALTSSFLDQPIPFEDVLQRREDGEPLEYILGHLHLNDLTLGIDQRALIPRPETETLVRRFLEQEPDLPPGPLIDCGTGSGFIASVLARESSREVVGVDRYCDPLELAMENRERMDSDFQLVQADLLTAIEEGIAGIVANLPYVRSDSDRLSDSVKAFEPREALHPEVPLDQFYERFFSQCRRIIKKGAEVWLEIDEALKDQFQSNVLDSKTWSEVEFIRDMNDRYRFLRMRK